MTQIAFKSVRGASHITMWRAFTLDGEDLTMTERAVSNFLALHYSSKRGYAYPSREAMSEALGVNPRSITRAIHGLREKGVWGVSVGRGGTRKGNNPKVSSRYYPSAAIVKRHINAIKEDKTRTKLENELSYFNAVVDSLYDEPQQPLPEDMENALDDTQGEDSVEHLEEDPVEQKDEGSLQSLYSGMPTALAGALTRKEADEFLSTSNPDKILEAYDKVTSLGNKRGAVVVAATLRKALRAAKVPPSNHRDGWAGWVLTFGLKHVPEKVHPLYNSASDLGEFVSLLDELNKGHQYRGQL